MGVSLNDGTPPFHTPKLDIFSRKTHGFVGVSPTILGFTTGTTRNLGPAKALVDSWIQVRLGLPDPTEMDVVDVSKRLVRRISLEPQVSYFCRQIYP